MSAGQDMDNGPVFCFRFSLFLSFVNITHLHGPYVNYSHQQVVVVMNSSIYS